jgi:signal transduction histidine kinase
MNLNFLKYVRSFSARLLFSYVLLALIPALVVSFVLISTTQNSIEKNVATRNIEISRRAASEIELFVNSAFDVLRMLTNTPTIVSMVKFEQSLVINKIKSEKEIFKKILILDENGRESVSTIFGEELKDFSNEELFKIAIRGNEYFSKVFFSEDNLPLMIISEPIIKYNKVIGVLVGEIGLKNIWDIVDNVTVDKTGSAFLVSKDGYLIAHHDKKKVYNQENMSGIPIVKKVINGEIGSGIFIDDSGKEIIGAYCPIKNLGWGIVIQQDVEEAFQISDRMRQRAIVFLYVSLVLATVLGILTVRRFTEPIKKMLLGTQHFSQGNLDFKIEVDRDDELGVLSKEFNDMASNLRYNQKILQRTERLAALSKFAAIASHEIRNPLNAMIVNMQILRREMQKDNPSTEKQVKYLDIVTSEIKRIDEMINSFLIMSRPPELKMQLYDIHSVINEVVELQYEKATRQRVKIEKKYFNGQAFAMIDINQLKQVFLNVVINAFQAMPEGGILTIYTEPVVRKVKRKKRQLTPENEKDEMFCIKFQDTGPGIPKDKINEIFDFYYTTKKSGSGFGLSIAQQIIQAHGGMIYAENPHEDSKGAIIVIHIPKAS